MKHEFDIIIVGAGTAGMACAIEASSNGATVALIDKADKIGGSMHWSGGHMSAGGTQLQKRNNIDDSIEDHYRDILNINGGSGDLTLIKKAVHEAPVTLDWLDDNGFDWAADCPRIIYGHVPYTKARTQYGSNKAISILETMMPHWEKGIASSRIHCMLSTEFVSFKENEESVLITCKQKDAIIELSAKHAVLTTGGYGSNHEFFKTKHGDIPYNSSTYPTSTGEMIQYLEKDHHIHFRMADLHLPSLGGLELEPGSNRSNFNEAWAMVLTSVYRQPRDIYVNVHGKRFMAEDEINADTREREVTKQDNWQFWVVFDENGLTALDDNGIQNSIIIGWTIDQIKAEAAKNKAIFVKDSIEELAQVTGLPSDALHNTIEDFNICVDKQEDLAFGRTYLQHKIETGPFYAVKVHASLLVTFGGVSVDHLLRLKTTEGKSYKRVYAAGEILGLGATSGNAFCSGMAITPALSFGRLLGRYLCEVDMSLAKQYS